MVELVNAMQRIKARNTSDVLTVASAIGTDRNQQAPVNSFFQEEMCEIGLFMCGFVPAQDLVVMQFRSTHRSRNRAKWAYHKGGRRIEYGETFLSEKRWFCCTHKLKGRFGRSSYTSCSSSPPAAACDFCHFSRVSLRALCFANSFIKPSSAVSW
jgi:hypothetical protein